MSLFSKVRVGAGTPAERKASMMRWIRGRPRPSLDLAGPEPDTGHAGIEGTRGVIDQQPLGRPAIGQDHRIRQGQAIIVDPDQVGGAEAVVAVHHAVKQRAGVSRTRDRSATGSPDAAGLGTVTVFIDAAASTRQG
ncbi:MAG: hypothetical protein Q8M01_22280 [Rubrivivax sp.]|nr:hypothetical protein [Rubrivivax sp.]